MDVGGGGNAVAVDGMLPAGDVMLGLAGSYSWGGRPDEEEDGDGCGNRLAVPAGAFEDVLAGETDLPGNGSCVAGPESAIVAIKLGRERIW